MFRLFSCLFICGPINSFIHFLQTTRLEFDLPQYSFRRRYQDFDWLRTKLEDSQPTHLIPVGHQLQAGRLSLVQPPFLTFLRVLVCSPCRRSL